MFSHVHWHGSTDGGFGDGVAAIVGAGVELVVGAGVGCGGAGVEAGVGAGVEAGGNADGGQVSAFHCK